jgi:peptidoglycan/xylan/chitin deacetylase (PgdA/CDA1 family)/CelD/BcsL family acetyltransferase involved in cellulose biosynthesis
MNFTEIRQESELWALKPAWDTLLKDSRSVNTFLTWEWVTAWWSAYGKPGELRILTARDDQGVLRGIAPLRMQSVRRYAQTARALFFLGDGSNDSDYLDFIVAKGYEGPVMGEFRAWLKSQLNQGTILFLNEMPSDSDSLPRLKELCGSGNIFWNECETPCGVVRLPGTWEEYLHMLRPRFRTKVRSTLRKLENQPEVRFGFCQDPEEVPRLLPVLFDLHTKRWNRDEKTGVFGWGSKRDFYSRLSPLLLERKWLRLSWLKWNDQVLACQYGFVYDGCYFQLQEGYEPACEHWNVGVGLRAWSIRALLSQGVVVYDFLGGVGRHKTDWAADTKHSKQILCARPALQNVLLLHGPQWQANAINYLSRILPSPLLKARRFLLNRMSKTKSGENSHSSLSAKGRLQSLAARFYVRSGLSAPVRRFRDQYQLSLSPNSRWAKVSWKKRVEGSARILCFYRINEDNDPFFPSFPTSAFERIVRYLSHRYRVLTLGGVLEHLAEGSTTPVLAITFDDGYQDNYQNAFPILQAYNVPATIFLTTGCMDSHEPLWFEQLSHSLKHTEREFIDLELDIPRRFWLRTREERLQANLRIFELLRSYQNAERKEALFRVLSELSVADHGERRDHMLTWDQIRLMKQQGIAFGGHTVTHPFLSRVPRSQLTGEILECKRRIESELQSNVEYFAYPHGRQEDFTNETKQAVRDAGYRAAVTSIWGLNHSAIDPMELRRSSPWETKPAMFVSKLDWYQLVNG